MHVFRYTCIHYINNSDFICELPYQMSICLFDVKLLHPLYSKSMHITVLCCLNSKDVISLYIPSC